MKISIQMSVCLLMTALVNPVWAASAASPPSAAALGASVKAAIEAKNWSKAKQELDAAYRASQRRRT
jgi:hypothetical protein